jgi:hypothetical protein
MLWWTLAVVMTLTEIMMVAVGAFLLWRGNQAAFWFLLTVPAVAGVLAGYIFMRGVGALGHAPTGVWGAVSRQRNTDGPTSGSASK